MANWVRDFLDSHPDHATWLIHKRAKHSLHFRRPDGQIEAHFTGAPCHYQDELGDWHELDTALVDLGNGYWGANGLIVRLNKMDRTVEIVGTGYSQRTARVAVLRPSTMAIRGTPVNIPVGTISGDSAIATGVIGGAAWEHRLRLTETGVRETITLASKPTISNVLGTDYLVLETILGGVTLPNGEVGEMGVAGMHFPLPRCTDANDVEAPCRRIARTASGVLRLYTGIPLSWLATAAYPIVLDPDFTGATADGLVTGASTNAATARSTATSHNTTGGDQRFNQGKDGATYSAYRLFLKFNTSTIGAGQVVTSVTLTMHVYTDTSFAGDAQIIKQNWSAQDPLSAANRDAAFDNCLSGDLDDHVLWSGYATTNTQYTSDTLTTTWVAMEGTTYYSLRGSRDYAATVPTSMEYCNIGMADNADAHFRPFLTVLYEAAAAGGKTRSYAVIIG
jgi:hypothetical protein